MQNLLYGIIAISVIAGIGYMVVTPNKEPTTIANTQPAGETVLNETKIDIDPSTAPSVSEVEARQDTMEKSAEVGLHTTEVKAETIVTSEADVEVIPEVAPSIPAATEVSQPGVYTDYSAETLRTSEADRIILTFHASWCPSCRALENDIVANAEAIPAGVMILKADYDTETTLKQQYGVTRQHSVLEVTADGTAVSSVSHPSRLSDILASL